MSRSRLARLFGAGLPGSCGGGAGGRGCSSRDDRLLVVRRRRDVLDGPDGGARLGEDVPVRPRCTTPHLSSVWMESKRPDTTSSDVTEMLALQLAACCRSTEKATADCSE